MRRTIPVVLSLVATLLAVTVAGVAATSLSSPANAGFEDDGAAVADPTAWKSRGDTSADFSEAGGRSGAFRLTHWSADPYAVTTSQKLTGLDNGWVTLRAAIRRSALGGSAWIGLQKCGRDDARTELPVSPGGWIEVVVSVEVTRHSCTIVIVVPVPLGSTVQSTSMPRVMPAMW